MRDLFEKHFGTDEALGVSLVDNRGRHYTPAQADALYNEYGSNMPDLCSEFPDGTSAITCTNYAIQMARKLQGRTQIFGFANEDNPDSRVAKEKIHPGGHDFAVVDNRWLVDPWIRLVAGESGPICFDMDDENDAALVLETYGPQECWKRMSQAEAEAAISLPAKPVVKTRLNGLSP